MSASWYDVLGVSSDATPDQVKAAWREATDKFEPGQGSGQFRMFNEAADVLLDPERRAAYDVEIGVAPTPAKKSTRTTTKNVAAKAPSVASDLTESSIGTVVLEKSRDSEDATAEPELAPTHQQPAGRSAPVWLMLILTALATAAVIIGFVFWNQTKQDSATDVAGDEASASAERALPAVLSYDYQKLKADRDQAARFLSPKYAKEYTATFDKLIDSSDGQAGPATQAKAVVKASVEDIGVVSAQSGRVRLVVFLNQTTSKDGAAPTLSLNRLTVSMVKTGNAWLIDNINSY